MFRIVLVLSLVLVFAACKKSDDSTSSTSSSTVTDSSMVTAMPSNLSVSSNTESGASVSSRTEGRSFASEINDNNDPKKHKDKVARLKAVLNSTDIGQCHKAIPKKMKGSGGKYVSCYGSDLVYVNHPYDSTDGTLPGGDLGIWTAYNDNTTQEACAVGQMNLLMDKIGRKVDLAMGITAMMICAAKNDGLTKPTIDGDALDVTTSVAKTKISGRGGMKVSEATLKRSKLASGKIKYTSKLEGSFTYNSTQQKFKIKFQHVPDTDSTSSGATGEGLVQMWQDGVSATDAHRGTRAGLPVARSNGKQLCRHARLRQAQDAEPRAVELVQ